MSPCLCCESPMRLSGQAWHAACPVCGYESGLLEVAINESSMHEAIDEMQRESGLHDLRIENAHELLGLLARCAPTGGRHLLDVGCAHGWFLKEACATFDALGLEPDNAVAEQARARGLPVRDGYFPDALAASEYFDVIVFNDVFEHIPDVNAAATACLRHLTHDGLLVLNVPNSRGIFYRVASLLNRVGVRGPFLRMWQYGLPSPHVHYFNRSSLQRLLETNGFEPVLFTTLQSVSRKGLWSRIRYAKGGLLSALITYPVVAALLPILAFFEQDSLVGIFRAKAVTGVAGAGSPGVGRPG